MVKLQPTRLKKSKRNKQPKQYKRPDLTSLRKAMPPFLSRKNPRFKELTGYSPRSFANMDSRGETNTIKRIMLGGSIAYESESMVDWLVQHSIVIS